MRFTSKSARMEKIDTICYISAPMYFSNEASCQKALQYITTDFPFVNSRNSLFRSHLCGHDRWQQHLLPVPEWHHISRNNNNPEAAQRSQWTIAHQTAEQLITAGVVWCVNEINFPSNYLGRLQATEQQTGVPSVSRQEEKVDALINCTNNVGIWKGLHRKNET